MEVDVVITEVMSEGIGYDFFVSLSSKDSSSVAVSQDFIPTQPCEKAS